MSIIRKCLLLLSLFFIAPSSISMANADFLSKEKNRISLIIAGTPFFTPIIRILGESFKSKHPEVDIFVDDAQQQIAFNLLKRGNLDIAIMAATLSPDQDTLLARSFSFARGALIAVINERNSIETLTPNNLRDVYSGKIENWKDLGGTSGPIKIILPSDGSLDLYLYKQVLGTLDQPSKTGTFIDNAKARLEQVANDPLKITFVRRREFLSNKIGKLLKINNYGISEQEILSQLYPLYISYSLVLWGEDNLLAKQFVDFSLSEEGQKIIIEQGQIGLQ